MKPAYQDFAGVNFENSIRHAEKERAQFISDAAGRAIDWAFGGARRASRS